MSIISPMTHPYSKYDALYHKLELRFSKLSTIDQQMMLRTQFLLAQHQQKAKCEYYVTSQNLTVRYIKVRPHFQYHFWFIISGSFLVAKKIERLHGVLRLARGPCWNQRDQADHPQYPLGH